MVLKRTTSFFKSFHAGRAISIFQTHRQKNTGMDVLWVQHKDIDLLSETAVRKSVDLSHVSLANEHDDNFLEEKFFELSGCAG